jgi:hypothetical protein
MLALNVSGNYKLKLLIIKKSLKSQAFHSIQVLQLPITVGLLYTDIICTDICMY